MAPRDAKTGRPVLNSLPPAEPSSAMAPTQLINTRAKLRSRSTTLAKHLEKALEVRVAT